MTEPVHLAAGHPGQRPMMAANSQSKVRYTGRNDAVLRLKLFQAWRLRCYSCRRPQEYRDVEIDHIIPRTISPARLQQLVEQHGLAADFDLHAPANLAPICGACNTEKSDRDDVL